MWSKITHALKPRYAHDESSTSSQGDVMNKVFEQHPNLSVFQPSLHSSNDISSPPLPSPPGSPSKGSRRGMFKRMSKLPLKDEGDSSKISGSLKMPIGVPKKVRPPLFNGVGNSSQLSLATNSPDIARPSTDISRRSSHDMLRTTEDYSRSPTTTSRPSIDVLRRPSLDLLRREMSHSSQDLTRPQTAPGLDDDHNASTPGFNERMGSVRSILRDPNTPGTGQNVRFFSRDAYKVISPDQSMEVDQSFSPPPPPPKDEHISFFNKLNEVHPESTSTPAAMRHSKSNSKSSRPSVSEVFSPLGNASNPAGTSSQDTDKSDMSLSSPVLTPNYSNIFDVSQQLELASFPPPGLGFDVNAPIFDQSIDLDSPFDCSIETKQIDAHATSTPLKAKDFNEGKQKATTTTEPEHNGGNLQVPMPTVVDETIFHATDVSPRFPTPLHDRSQSFTLGQTVFYSMADTSRDSSNMSAAYPSSDLKTTSTDNYDSPSRASLESSTKSRRARALSDSVFQNMLRATPPRAPEADINDESCENVVVSFAAPVAEPDPFSAHATTYYTPQTMIPTTPPQASNHSRKTSKEENLIFSLQTQLALQTELCQQYEADLRARDELVEILGKKLSDIEKDEGRRKTALRSWKKKVQELERACRQLEDEVDQSRQMSMERSVMDEASSEALRMLHRQIAALERDKADQQRKEDTLKEEVETLEVLVKERSEDIMNLKDVLWSRDENERELKEGIRDVKEQMEQLGNVSMGAIDEEELKKIFADKQQKTEEEKARHHIVEVTWQQEKEELTMKLEGLQVEKASWEEELEKAKQQCKNRDEEYALLKVELQAQWGHTEKSGEVIKSLQKENIELVKGTDRLKELAEELKDRIGGMEDEWSASEARKADLETEIQKLWHLKEALEKDRDQIDYELQQEQEHAESLTTAVQEREDRIAQLEQEVQFAAEKEARLQETNRKRDQEIAEYVERVVKYEAETERLLEEMSTVKREHNRYVDEQARSNRDSAGQEAEMKANVENLIRLKAESDIEVNASREKIGVLKDEVERLRRHVHELQQESADKEVKIVQLSKQKALDKDDMVGLNIALDSKQQELELLKRNLGLRGTAGSTPVQASKVPNRRDSAVFNKTPISRPPSTISDSGVEDSSVKERERKQSSERPSSASSASSISKPVSALGRSTRINAASGGTPSSKASIPGSMGPPPNPTKPRPSVATSGTPTPTARSLSRSSSTRPSLSVTPSGTPLPHRRVSSAVVALEQRSAAAVAMKKGITSKTGTRVTSPVPSVAEGDEKENAGESIGMSTTTNARRRVMVPTAI